MGYENFAKRHGRTLSRQLAKTAKNKKGGGGGGYFGDRFTLPCVDEDPANIIVFPGEYKTEIVMRGEDPLVEIYDYGLVFDHFNGVKKTSFPCSAGLQLVKDRDGDWVISTGKKPCVACWHISNGTGKGISRRKLHVFNIVVLDHFHQVDSDKTGSDGKPYKNWVTCEGRRCKYCKKGLERTFGRHMYWPVGSGYLGNMLGYEMNIFSKHCQCGGELEPIAFQCSNPNCQEVIRDLEDDPASKKELIKLRNRAYKCPECDNEDIMDEVPECDECNRPAPIGMFDVVMQVSSSMTLKDKENKDFVKSNLLIPQWRRISEKDMKRAKPLMEKPFDFYGKLYKPLTIEEQADKFDISNPYDDEDDDGRARPRAVEWEEDDDE